MSNFCAKCGAVRAPSSLFCSGCGESFTQEGMPERVAPVAGPAAPGPAMVSAAPAQAQADSPDGGKAERKKYAGAFVSATVFSAIAEARGPHGRQNWRDLEAEGTLAFAFGFLVVVLAALFALVYFRRDHRPTILVVFWLCAVGYVYSLFSSWHDGSFALYGAGDWLSELLFVVAIGCLWLIMGSFPKRNVPG